MAENTQAVHTLAATDVDTGQTVTFSVSGSGADNSKFEVTNGNQLQFKAAPNFEAPTDADADNVYEVTVQADDGNGGMTPQTISVTVTDANDSTVITSPSTANVAENTQVVHTLTFTDEDAGQTPRIRVAGPGFDNRLFEIIGDNQLQFIAAPNFEAPTDHDGDNVYVVTVVTEDGVNISVQTILVTVTDANDSTVITSPSTANVAENTQVVHTLTATDEDAGQTVTYSISGSGADNSKFEITSGNQLQFKAAPDFETPTDADTDNIYEVSVQADDGNGGTTAQTIAVTVTDVNEIVPQVESVVVDNGTAQRSMVRSLTVTFNQAVTIASGAFSLDNTTTSAADSFTVADADVDISTDAVTGKTVAVLTFTNSTTGILGGSLNDGNYTLKVDATKIQTGSTAMAANHTDDFFRLFGDSDGNRQVNPVDLDAFLATFLMPTSDPSFDSSMDHDSNNQVNPTDLSRFLENFLAPTLAAP